MTPWQQWQARFKTLKPREKWSALGGISFLVVWFFLLQWLMPNLDLLAKEQKKIQQLQSQFSANEALLATLHQQQAIDPNAHIRESIAKLRLQEQQLQSQISSLTQYFMGSEKMTVVLQDVLKGGVGVRVKSVKVATPEPLNFFLQAQKSNEPSQSSVPSVYQHRTFVVLEGNYQALTAVLHQLDRLPWALGGQNLQYKVTRFPLAELTLELVTVSEYESYIKL